MFSGGNLLIRLVSTKFHEYFYWLYNITRSRVAALNAFTLCHALYVPISESPTPDGARRKTLARWSKPEDITGSTHLDEAIPRWDKDIEMDVRSIPSLYR